MTLATNIAAATVAATATTTAINVDVTVAGDIATSNISMIESMIDILETTIQIGRNAVSRTRVYNQIRI